MDQLSRPLLIVLAATIALVAVWLVALKPKPPSVGNTPLAPTQAIPQAKQAAAASDAANDKLQAKSDAAGGTAGAPNATGGTAAAPNATGGTAAAPNATGGTAKAPPVTPKAGAKAASSRDAAVLRDIRAKKVVVMLFWNAKGAEDIATRGVLRGLDRRNGKVVVRIVPISRVGQYDSITRGVRIIQAPTTIVIDRKRRTRVITGLTERQELEQAVGDAVAGR
jgi:hypothetical protein